VLFRSGAQGNSGSSGSSGTSGTSGAQGAQGASGTSGTSGAQGAQGAVGAQGKDGSSGTSGAQGAQGATGPQGAQGASSTSATSILTISNSSSSIFYPTFVDSNNAVPGAQESVYTSDNLTFRPIGGILYVSGRVESGDGTTANPAYTFINDGNTGMYRIGADNLGLVTGAFQRINIDSGGLVGINRTPAYRLDISTGARVNNEIGIRLDNTSGEGLYFVPYVSFAAAYTNNSIAGDVVISSTAGESLTIGAGGSNAGFRFISLAQLFLLIELSIADLFSYRK
jgi:hypothetical protein